MCKNIYSVGKNLVIKQALYFFLQNDTQDYHVHMKVD